MSSPLDSNLCRRLGEYVEGLTHSGQKILDKDTLKKLKNICKYASFYTMQTTVLESDSHFELAACMLPLPYFLCCRISDVYVEHAYHFLMYQLGKGHAEIRFSAFQICDELFR
jgi:hypothetical protein